MSTAILDVDGTLVDTNYQHALAWYRAFRTQGLVLPLWRIHRHIGMGGDQLVAALTDESTEERCGERIRSAEKDAYAQMIEEVEPFACAQELLAELRRRGHTVVLASSAKPEEVEHYLQLLRAHDGIAAWTSAEVVQATKPAPDLVRVALAKAGARAADAVLLGDSPWDVRAAAAAGVGCLAVMTGGFAREELSQAGAMDVFQSLDELLGSLERTPLR